MIYRINNPNMLEGIPDTFLALKYTDGAGPIMVAVEKSAIRYDPPGTAPETEAEWEVVADSLGETLKPLVFKLSSQSGMDRSNQSGVRWRHLDLSAAMLAENGVQLQTQAHYMLRRSQWVGGEQVGHRLAGRPQGDTGRS
jgi:hypothetical protein